MKRVSDRNFMECNANLNYLHTKPNDKLYNNNSCISKRKLLTILVCLDFCTMPMHPDNGNLLPL